VRLRQAPLLYFVTVADEGQMTRAARKLHVAQPALSQAIAQLESELGVELLARHARGVTLTPAGEAFLAKARAALEAMADATQTAQSLARSAQSSIALGFLGSPPALHTPELFAAFAAVHPDVAVSFRELPMPHGPTATWLSQVDVAICHPPAPDADTRMQTLRIEPRVVVAPRSSPLAERRSLDVAEVLDETFLCCHTSVDPGWAGFWSLDDHRGKPPARVASGGARTAEEMLANIASGRGITTLAACQAELIVKVLPEVVAIPLRDAHPAEVALLWRSDCHNPLVEDLVAVARSIGAGPDAVQLLASTR
jgi:DNA-binding transcriptional LysR family regulator